MATETTHLIYTDTREYGHLDTGEAKNLRQVLADIRAGRVHVGPVLIYTLIAVIGSFMFGYVLGYSSLTQISLSQDSKNATHSSSHVDMDFQLTDDEFSYFGVSTSTCILYKVTRGKWEVGVNRRNGKMCYKCCFYH